MLTPLGRGSSLLVIGPEGAGKSTLALDAIIGQKGAQVGSSSSSSQLPGVGAGARRAPQQQRSGRRCPASQRTRTCVCGRSPQPAARLRRRPPAACRRR
jgi:ABC-type Mn2+/Zn2+ transport system ATPase subunit